MRILHVSPNLSTSYGGPTYSLVGYARAALDAGNELTIVGAGRQSDRSWLTERLPEADVRLFGYYGAGAFVASPSLMRFLRRDANRYDVIHVHGLLNPISSFAARACIGMGRPVVIRPYGTLSRYTYAHRRSMLKHAFFRNVDGPNLGRARAVHFTTDQERDEAAWHGIDWAGKAFVIPPPWIGSPGKRSLSLNANTVVVLSRLNPVKHIELVIDAWPLVLAEIPGARLVIAGDGDAKYVQMLRRRAAPHGDTIEFRGFVSGAAKDELLTSSAVFVLPSHHENFGIAVLEALASGIPVVITKEVQLADFVREHALGIIAERYAEALGAALVAALGNSELRKRCRQQGRRVIEQYFSPATIGDELSQMYRYASTQPPRLLNS